MYTQTGTVLDFFKPVDAFEKEPKTEYSAQQTKDKTQQQIDEILDIDAKDASALNVKGTPTIFVNDKKLERLSEKDLFDLVEAEVYK